MNNNRSVSSADAERAMQEILQAERDAEQAITACENTTQQITQDAQTKAQRIHTRANERITNMEMRHGHKLNQLINSIDEETTLTLQQEPGVCHDEKRLRTIVQQLAMELCSCQAGPGRGMERGK